MLGSSPAMPMSGIPDPDTLMRLAAARIAEMEEQAVQVQAFARGLANVVACLITKMTEVAIAAGAPSSEDGEVAVVLDNELTERCNGARMRLIPQEDGSLGVTVLIPENFERYEAAEAAAQAELADALGIDGTEEVPSES